MSACGRRIAGSVLAAIAGAAALGCEMRAAPPAGGLGGYDLAGEPEWRVTLPDELREISGLATSPDGRLFAHGDEEGTIFQLDARTGRVLKRFTLAPTGQEPALGKKTRSGRVTGDFEDIAIVGDRFFLVSSNGVLVEFGEGADGARVPYTVHQTRLGERCEVEGLAYEAAAGALLLLCKEMRRKWARGEVLIYAWSLRSRRLEASPRIAVTYATLSRITGARTFNGSALTFGPGGSSVLLVAGPQRLFAELNTRGWALRGGALDQPQPEGAAFLPDGTLLISSEGRRGEATLSGYRPSSLPRQRARRPV
jgi:uncharacterized protein YjiK